MDSQHGCEDEHILAILADEYALQSIEGGTPAVPFTETVAADGAAVGVGNTPLGLPHDCHHGAVLFGATASVGAAEPVPVKSDSVGEAVPSGDGASVAGNAVGTMDVACIVGSVVKLPWAANGASVALTAAIGDDVLEILGGMV